MRDGFTQEARAAIKSGRRKTTYLWSAALSLVPIIGQAAVIGHGLLWARRLAWHEVCPVSDVDDTTGEALGAGFRAMVASIPHLAILWLCVWASRPVWAVSIPLIWVLWPAISAFALLRATIYKRIRSAWALNDIRRRLWDIRTAFLGTALGMGAMRLACVCVPSAIAVALAPSIPVAVVRLASAPSPDALKALGTAVASNPWQTAVIGATALVGVCVGWYFDCACAGAMANVMSVENWPEEGAVDLD